MFQEGDRVRATSEMYSGTGTVMYVDQATLFQSHYSPIQVELDEGDEDGHRIKRFNLKELEKVD